MKGDNNAYDCYWPHRLELLGIVLIVIATILTIITASSLGIAAMLIVGALLCAHKCIRGNVCSVCHPDESDISSDVEVKEKRPATKKTTPRKTAVKPQ